MTNPFNSKSYRDQGDAELIQAVLTGNKQALTELIQVHQRYIYNVALKFFNSIEDAEDATQEILIKVITKLSTYKPEKATFRTWLYRITFHHFLNAKKSAMEIKNTGFDFFSNMIDHAADLPLNVEEEISMKEQIAEAKVACTTGMIMCLDRDQRLIFIIGEVFEISHTLGAEIFEISPANFRQKLSRARKDLYSWANNKCGLVNTNNPCRCPKKTKTFIKNGWIDVDNMKWHTNYTQKMTDITSEKCDEILDERELLYKQIYKEHPFKSPRITGEEILKEIIDNEAFKQVFDL